VTPYAEWRADRRVVDLLSTLQSPRWISRNRKLDSAGGG
jgi:hypothetical protein